MNSTFIKTDSILTMHRLSLKRNYRKVPFRRKEFELLSNGIGETIISKEIDQHVGKSKQVLIL